MEEEKGKRGSRKGRDGVGRRRQEGRGERRNREGGRVKIAHADDYSLKI